MRFSILVPVYNVENYIEQCLDSILAQSYKDYELILVDDGSTDRSGEICDEYKEKHPSKIRVIHKENQGLISARRVGIEEAKGEFCIFVDSDDFVEHNLLEKVNDYIESNVEIDILLYSFVYYLDGEKIKRKTIVADDGYIWSGNNKNEIYEKISCGSDITSMWTKAIRTSILKEDTTNYKVYYGKNMAEDLLQSLYPLTVAKKIIYMNQVLYNYRINDKSISHNFKVQSLDEKSAIHVYDKIYEYLSIWGMADSEMLLRVQAKWFNDAMYLFSQFYQKSKERKQKEILVSYNWKSWLPNNDYDENNRFINKKYLQLYKYLQKRDMKKIEKYFWDAKVNGNIKNLKKRIKEIISNG